MRRRRAIAVFIIGLIITIALAGAMPALIERTLPADTQQDSTLTDSQPAEEGVSALDSLKRLEIKGRASKTGYTRAQFGDGWAKVDGCTMRNIILHRDLRDVVVHQDCTVASGVLDDLYTGETIVFTKEQSTAVQIDHVVALSDAWQKGAQALSKERRMALANDPLELIAASGKANQQKGDGDAATWLPDNKAFRCMYIARQIAVKLKYQLWVTSAEHDAMEKVLSTCPNERLPL